MFPKVTQIPRCHIKCYVSKWPKMSPKFLGYFCKQNCYREHSNITQSRHTDSHPLGIKSPNITKCKRHQFDHKSANESVSTKAALLNLHFDSSSIFPRGDSLQWTGKKERTNEGILNKFIYFLIHCVGPYLQRLFQAQEWEYYAVGWCVLCRKKCFVSVNETSQARWVEWSGLLILITTFSLRSSV